MDWHTWHADYDRPDSALSRRLSAVQKIIKDALNEAPPGPLRILSLCAGQGRDLIPVLAEHPRRDDVRARLVELDPRNTAVAAAAAQAAGLADVVVVTGDAALTDHYSDLVPAHIVLACGIFGNITDADVERTIGVLDQFTATGGVVVWTRHREAPDLVPQIGAWFCDNGFDQIWVSEPGVGFGVGAHRFTGAPRPLVTGAQLFTFVGSEVLRGRAVAN
ncbi:class I SAM-dependent methyltransferase family protein [Mycolicibacterium goodii]|uniref:Methyltransferase n=1 Tax=Mycolicibacterium goodii TaxID=134601 RepID=A0A0K0XGS9_MYCGD|nr:methyltransferase [Mycolicibacterium goodii]